MKNSKIGAIITGVLLVGLVVGGFKSIHKIPAGYVGIVYNVNGGVEDRVLTQGLRFALPWEKVSKYTVSTEQAYLSKDAKEGSKDDDSYDIPTSDGKTINVDCEFSYHFDQEKLPDTYTRFKGQTGKDIEASFIKAKIKAFTQEVSSKFSVIDIYGDKRSELNAETKKYAQQQFADYGIVIDTLNFTRIGLDDQTANAIQNRINKQQEVETAKLERDKASIEADKKKVEAQGEADSQLIKAQGEAKSNELTSASMNQTLIDLKNAEAKVKQSEAMKNWTNVQVVGGDTITSLK